MPSERYDIAIGAADETKQALASAQRNLEKLRAEMEGIGDAPLVDRKKLDELRRLQKELQSVSKALSDVKKQMAKPSGAGGGTRAAGGGAASAMGAPAQELAQGSKAFEEGTKKAKQHLADAHAEAKKLRRTLEGAGGAAGRVGGKGGGGRAGGAAAGAAGAAAGGAVGGNIFGQALNNLAQAIGGIEIAGFSVGALAAIPIAGVQAMMGLADKSKEFMGGQVPSARLTGFGQAVRGAGGFRGGEMHQAFAAFATESGNRATFREEMDRKSFTMEGEAQMRAKLQAQGLNEIEVEKRIVAGRTRARPRQEWLAGRAGAIGMGPAELATILGKATRLSTDEERRRYAGYAPPGAPAGIESQVGMTRMLQSFAREAGMEGPRAAIFMRKVTQQFETAISKGQAVSMEQVARGYSRIAGISPRMEALAPTIMGMTEGASGAAGATLGGSPASNFLIRSMGAYMRGPLGMKDVGMEQITDALQGGEVQGLGRALSPTERIMSAFEGAKRLPGRGGMRRFALREALQMQGLPMDVMRKLEKEFEGGTATEGSIQSILDQNKAGQSGKKTTGIEVAGELPGLVDQFERFMKLELEREKMLTGPGAMFLMEKKMEMDLLLAKAAGTAADAIFEMADAMGLVTQGEKSQRRKKVVGRLAAAATPIGGMIRGGAKVAGGAKSLTQAKTGREALAAGGEMLHGMALATPGLGSAVGGAEALMATERGERVLAYGRQQWERVVGK